MYQSYHECTTYTPWYNFKPSLGINGRYCQCYKLEYNTNPITVSQKEGDAALAELKQETEEIIEYTSMNHIVHLKQSDFEHGTYRIS